jgi:hypothetical protein
MRNSIPTLILAGLAGFTAGPVFAQWTTQTILLRPGWNAVFLEIQPEPRQCDALFAGLQVESVWRYNRQAAAIQFIDDPSNLVPNQPDWLTYLSPGHPLAAASGLFTIEGGRPYLIKRSDDAPPVPWPVHGTPVIRPINWLVNSLNFVGFPLADNSVRTFRSFLSHAPALATNAAYRLASNGVWVRVNAPATTALPAGESFWIRATGPCDYGGTLAVDLNRRAGLQFGQALTEETLRIRNTSSVTNTITVRNLASDEPRTGDHPALAGRVPMSYWMADLGHNYVGWTNLPAQLVSNVPPGGQWELRLAVRRPDMALPALPVGASGALYQELLEISDGVTRLRVPVTSQGLSAATSGASLPRAARQGKSPAPASPDRVGLWVGSATFRKVNQPQDPVAPQTPTNTASVLQFRLIVHVDDQGQSRLLQKVLQRWENGTTKPAEDGSTNLVVGRSGRFVLLTDEKLAARYQGAAVVDGQAVGRRFSTAAFGFRQPVTLDCTNEFGVAGSVCTTSVVLDYDDPLNPFKHTYHPDHDNLNGRFTEKLAEGRESYTVTRQIRMQFLGQDPDGLNQAGWGDKQLGGVYRETFIGLHRDPLVAEGTFQLFRVSPVGVLDPPLETSANR